MKESAGTLDIRFKPLPAVGPGVGKWTHVRLPEFLLRYGAMLYRGFIPPLSVINDFFGLGRYDAGMSGGALWKAFSITESQYRALVQELQEINSKLKPTNCPDWVLNRNDWHIYLDEMLNGIPSELQRPHMKKIKALEEGVSAAIAAKDEAVLKDRSMELILAHIDLQEAIEKYAKKK